MKKGIIDSLINAMIRGGWPETLNIEGDNKYKISKEYINYLDLFYLDEKGSLQIQDLGPALTPEIIKSAQSIIKGVNEKKQNNNVEEKNIDESN